MAISENFDELATSHFVSVEWLSKGTVKGKDSDQSLFMKLRNLFEIDEISLLFSEFWLWCHYHLFDR